MSTNLEKLYLFVRLVDLVIIDITIVFVEELVQILLINF